MECNAFAELWPPKRMDKRNSNKKIVTFSFNGIAESFVAENHAASFLPFFLSFVLFLFFFFFVRVITQAKRRNWNDVNFLSDNPGREREKRN